MVLGDFNCTVDTDAIGLMKSAGFVELFGYLNPNEPGLTWDNERNACLQTHSTLLPSRRIDLVLIDQNLLGKFAPKTCRLVFTDPKNGTFASDHFGVCAEF